MNGSLKNNNGQALVETLYSLPLLASGVLLVMGGLHSLLIYYVTDYSTYSSTLCLVQEVPMETCRQNFKKNVDLLPFAKIEILDFQSSTNGAVVKTKLSTTLIGDKIFTQKLARSLRSSDFRRAP